MLFTEKSCMRRRRRGECLVFLPPERSRGLCREAASQAGSVTSGLPAGSGAALQLWQAADLDPGALQAIPEPFRGSQGPWRGSPSPLKGSRQLEQSAAAPAKRGAARSHPSCQARRNGEAAGLAGKTLTKGKKEKKIEKKEKPQGLGKNHSPSPGGAGAAPPASPPKSPSLPWHKGGFASPRLASLPSPQPPRPGRRLTPRLASPHRRPRPPGSPWGLPSPGPQQRQPLA